MRKNLKKCFCPLFLILIFSILSIPAFSGEFKIYPGSKLDENITKEANDLASQIGMKVKASIYITSDSFEKVYAFYKGISTEYKMPENKEKLIMTVDGKKYSVKEAYFIFDDAKELISSKLWIKIQRPFIGSMEDMEINRNTGEITFKNVRDLTVISVSDSR